MNEQIVSAIVSVLEKGGTEVVELAKLYIWLNSPIGKAFAVIMGLAAFLPCAYLVIRWWYSATKELKEELSSIRQKLS